MLIKFTICLPIVGGSLRVLRLLAALKLVTMILLKVVLKHQKSNQIKSYILYVREDMDGNEHERLSNITPLTLTLVTL